MKKENDYLCVNKALAKEYGCDVAMFLAAINQRGNLNNYFECTISDLENSLGFGRRLQERILKNLAKLNILGVCIKGIPPKRYIKINYANLPDCLKENPTEIITFKEKPQPKPQTIKIKDEFEQLWSQYPNKQGKQKAFIAYEKAVKSGTTFEDVMQGIQNYNFFIEQTRLDQQYVKHGSTWFNQHAWEDDYTVIQREPKPRDTLHERNKRTILNWLAKSGDKPNDYKTDVSELFSGIR